MINNAAFEIMKCFPRSFINQHGELIVHREANEYFNIGNCVDDLEIKYKVLEWLSRGAAKTEPFRSKKKNDEFNAFMLNGINKFLETKFDHNDMTLIYQELGNKVDRALTEKFVASGYDLNVLNKSR
jgi:hypothetical protein